MTVLLFNLLTNDGTVGVKPFHRYIVQNVKTYIPIQVKYKKWNVRSREDTKNGLQNSKIQRETEMVKRGLGDLVKKRGAIQCISECSILNIAIPGDRINRWMARCTLNKQIQKCLIWNNGNDCGSNDPIIGTCYDCKERLNPLHLDALHYILHSIQLYIACYYRVYVD